MPSSRPRSITLSVLWNLLGQASPLVVAFFAIPPLLRDMGVDRFGALSMVWVISGYLSLFDLGLGRALTRAVAEQRATGRADRLGDASWTALLCMFLLGLGAAAALVLLAGPLAEHMLRVPDPLRAEMRSTVVALAWSLPFVLSTAGLRGLLEAHHRFGIVSVIRVVMGLFQFLAPLAVWRWHPGLPAVVIALGVARAAAWLVHLVAALVVMPELKRGFRFAPGEIVALVRDGGWMTVTNVVGPVLVYADRFLLGAISSARAVAYYATPFELVTRWLVVPGALTGVLFPTFAADHTARPERAGRLYDASLAVILTFMFPPAFLLSAFAPELLRLWVGADFARNGTAVLRWLTVGVVVNSLAHVPFALLQAAGRSRNTARVHALELLLYGAVAWWAIRTGGPLGAAIAWTTRIAFDAVVMFLLARSLVVANAARDTRRLYVLGVALAAFAIVDATPGLAGRATISALALAGFAVSAWRWLLGSDEREWIRARFVTAEHP